MSVFDLFRGFFGVPGGHFRGTRDPFFDAMTHDDEDEDDDDDDEEDGFHHDGFGGDQQDPFDGAWRFGFSFGPDGARFQEPAVFGHVLREMEEIFSQLGRWEGHPEILPPSPPQDRSERSGGSGNPLRDFMLKSPDSDIRRSRQEDPSEARPSFESPDFPRAPFNGWSPFSKFNDFWGPGPQRSPDHLSVIFIDVLFQTLTPKLTRDADKSDAGKNKTFFFMVGVNTFPCFPVTACQTVEERRTVRDGHGNEKTTVTRTGSPGRLEGPDQTGPGIPGDSAHFSDLRDDESLFSRFFGGFK
uniref:HCLS1 associated protein X-1 n=1 Tax=Fundulus heteroclitus TaxID=8078 RepID=A0A3Q2PBY6_FUNHE